MPLPDKPTVPETNDYPPLSCVESKTQDHPNVILSSEEERKLWQKIDIRLLPIISFMYLWSFMDRGEQFVAFQPQTCVYMLPTGNIGETCRTFPRVFTYCL